MSDSSSEEGPPTKIIRLEKTQVYLTNNLTKSASIEACCEAYPRNRNDTASRYEDSGIMKYIPAMEN